MAPLTPPPTPPRAEGPGPNPRRRLWRRGLAWALALALGAGLVACMGKPDVIPDGDPGAGARALGLTLRPLEVELTAAPGVRLLSASALSSESPAFGGLSAIEVSQDGVRIIAISDAGSWLTARLTRDGTRISGVIPDGWGALRGPDGAALIDDARDAEGLALRPDGALSVSFERENRVSRYDAPGVSEQVRRRFGEDAGMGLNSGLEALALRPDGALLAVREAGMEDQSAQLALILPPEGAPREIVLRKPEGLRIVGADIDADGALWVVRRGFSWLGGFYFDLATMAPEGGGYGPPRLLARVQGAGADNAEGLAVWRDDAGATRLLVVSDDNFMPFQKTVLYEFEVR
jgi:hypothetical protein